MSRPLMPKATALWLLKNTKLTERQISVFCDLHPLQLQVLSQSDFLHASDPISTGQLTLEEIARCEANTDSDLELSTMDLPKSRRTTKKYTPLSKRQEIPHTILWLLKTYPALTDAHICTVLPTTRAMVKSIREGTYWNMKALTPKDPILLGLCNASTLEEVLDSL
jgi:hypothetical protein